MSGGAFDDASFGCVFEIFKVKDALAVSGCSS
jgi:hypothetical protein